MVDWALKTNSLFLCLFLHFDFTFVTSQFVTESTILSPLLFLPFFFVWVTDAARGTAGFICLVASEFTHHTVQAKRGAKLCTEDNPGP